MRRVTLVCFAMMAHTAHARGFSTVLPMQVLPQPRQDQAVAAPSGLYVDAPLAHPMVAAGLQRTGVGKIMDRVREGLSASPHVTRDPTTGASIGAFGEAYTYASPVGRGLAQHGETVGTDWP